MTAKITSIIGVAVALGLTYASGVMQRQVSGQWGDPEEMKKLAAGIDSIPESFGPWQLTDTKELGAYAEKILYCEGYINHTYVHKETRESVNVAVILGPPGPISVHTPEICYSSRDFTPEGKREELDLEDGDGEESQLWSLRFQSNDVEARKLHVCYGWTTDGKWTAANNPRFEYAGKPYLLKIQLAAESTERDGASEDEAEKVDIGQTFLEDFLPIVRQHVFSSQEQ